MFLALTDKKGAVTTAAPAMADKLKNLRRFTSRIYLFNDDTKVIITAGQK